MNLKLIHNMCIIIITYVHVDSASFNKQLI